ncbi:MAG: glycosyl transferase family 2 [Gemmatales bacterium]|nr:MAG: glycosyl transferase family 2 [Gemmatales bacterium]
MPPVATPFESTQPALSKINGAWGAGWLRVCLNVSAQKSGQVAVVAEVGEEKRHHLLESAFCPGQVQLHFYATIPEKTYSVFVDLSNLGDTAKVERFSVRRVSAAFVWWHALLGKWRQVCSVGHFSRAAKNAFCMLLRGRLHELNSKLRDGLERATIAPRTWQDTNGAYARWRSQRQLSEMDRSRIRTDASRLTNQPLISVLMPVCDVPETYLREAIESVQRQLYPNWELCIVDDASQSAAIRSLLESYPRQDSRIRIAFQADRRGISATTNRALDMARGEYIALLDHDDRLAEHALFAVARHLSSEPWLDMIYSDEDKLERDGRHVEPFFKPDWSPENMLSFMYTCHLGVYRTSLVRQLGGFRKEFDFAQDYDLVLRLAARQARIGHIPDILYHWRKHPGSSSFHRDEKPRAVDAARRALQAHLNEMGEPADVEPGPVPDMHRVRFRLRCRPLVSIIVASACRKIRTRTFTGYLLRSCLTSIVDKSTYSPYEIIVMHAPSASRAVLREILDEVQGRRGRQRHNVNDFLPRVVFRSYPLPFNFSQTMNEAAQIASGDYLLFLNDDMEVLSPDWMESLLGFAQRSTVGAVGAKLLFPDGKLQHAGIAILNGVPGHPFYGFPGQHPGYFGSNLVPHNRLAVTGACLMTRRDVFADVGGFDVSLPLNYNDVDFCLRIYESGKRIVCNPYAQLIHYESLTKPGVFQHELTRFQARWRQRLPRDPYYNPNLSHESFDYRIRSDDKGERRWVRENTAC